MNDVSSDDSKQGKLIMEPKKDKRHRKITRMAAGAQRGLAIGLSPGVLFGIVMDNIGPGL